MQAHPGLLHAGMGKVRALLKLHATHFGGEESTAVDALTYRHLSAVNPTRALANLHRALVDRTPSASELWAATKRSAKEALWGVPEEQQIAIPNQAEGAPNPAAAVSSQQQAVAQSHGEQWRTVVGQDGYLRTALIYVLASASRSFMHSLNSTEVHNAQAMERALQRPSGQALITVCNHVAAMDDPLVLSTVVPPTLYSKAEHIRWTLCASDRCFKYAALSPLFTAAKVLPIHRGGGMHQPGMQAAEDRLKHGDWVHIFPEGTRSQGGGKMGPVRKGVGKLVASCDQPPLVVPFVHSGMEQVMPRGKALPNVGKKVRVLVGEPIPVDDLLAKAARYQWSDDQLHSAVAARVSTHLRVLKERLEAGVPLGADAGVVLEAGVDAGVGGVGGVSSLDLYDEADLRWHHRASMWEKMKFRMQRRRWLLDGATGPSGVGVSVAAAAAGAGAAREQGRLSRLLSKLLDNDMQQQEAVGAGSLPAEGDEGARAGAERFDGSEAAAPLPSRLRLRGAWESGALRQYASQRLERVVQLLQGSPDEQHPYLQHQHQQHQQQHQQHEQQHQQRYWQHLPGAAGVERAPSPTASMLSYA